VLLGISTNCIGLQEWRVNSGTDYFPIERDEALANCLRITNVHGRSCLKVEQVTVSLAQLGLDLGSSQRNGPSYGVLALLYISGQCLLNQHLFIVSCLPTHERTSFGDSF